MNEALLPEMSRLLSAAGFDPEAYTRAHADLVAGIKSDQEAFWHFCYHGCREGRQFPLQFTSSDALTALSRFTKFARAPEILRAMLFASLQRWDDQHDVAQLVSAVKSVLPELKIAFVVVIGDSHTEVYKAPAVVDRMFLMPVRIKCVGGSALGLNNPKSISGYGNMIKDALQRVSADPYLRDAVIVFKFGQVDTEFVYNFQRVKAGKIKFDMRDYEEFSKRSTDAYGAFLEHAIPSTLRDKVDVFGIFPPVLSDDVLKSGYYNADITRLENQGIEDRVRASLRGLEHPDWSTRVQMHSAYNKTLKDQCERLGLSYVDDFSYVLDENGLPSPRFWKRHGGADHHVVLSRNESVFINQLASRLMKKRHGPVAKRLRKLKLFAACRSLLAPG